VPLHVAEDERRRLEPRDPPERREVGPELEIAVPLLPARDLVARDGLHLHVEREQVVAALDLVPGADLLDEVLAVEPFSHQATLHVGEGDDDRVDRARLDLTCQVVHAQHGGDPSPSGQHD
jgi:hypothetical protein